MVLESIGITNVDFVESRMPDRKMAAASIWFVHGSGDESRLPAGISHFMEHMMFKGTKTFSGTEAIEKIETLGGEINAFTTRHHICVYCAAPRETFLQVMDLMLQMVFRPYWKTSDFELEKSVIHNEIDDVLDTPEDYIEDEWYERFIQNHALGKPVLGTHDTLNSISLPMLRDFHRRLAESYRKIITVAGNFDSQAMQALVKRHIPAQETRPQEAAKIPPAFSSFNTKRRIDTNQAHILQGFSLPNVRLEDFFLTEIANLILGNGMSSLLFNNLREKRGAAYSVYSYVDYLKDFSVLGVYAACSPDKLNECQSGIDECLLQLGSRGFLEHVVPGKIKQLRYNLEMQLDSPGKRMLWLGQMAVYYPDFTRAFRFEDALDDLKVNDVLNWFESHFQSIRSARICLLPEDET